ncbi:MAG: hypothetical protein CMJ84_01530 [Planctomycetes bacterium]|jgi:hypothetical protein|nr:hypothetical protein [Planctomycetota bacterium]MDP6409630.1 FG-GAP-like repeat-containing protein [Planctomycetota bacterium]
MCHRATTACRRRAWTPLALLCVGGFQAARAQGPLFVFDGDATEDRCGRAVAGAGDVNADGHDDVIVGAWRDDDGALNGGRARVYSGADGSLLHTFDGAASEGSFGVAVDGAGDVNADGFDDLIVGAMHDPSGGTESGAVFVYSGSDGTLLHSWTGAGNGERHGAAVAGAGDVNGDGFDDVICGSPTRGGGFLFKGGATVYSGQNGTVLYNYDGGATSEHFGAAVSGAGDIDGDGRADFVIGIPGGDVPDVDAGGARVYAGADGSLLYEFHGDGAGDRFGTSVAAAGDVDGDGTPDLIVGAHGADNGGSCAGIARVFSGTDGSVLFTLIGADEGDWFGGSVDGAGDVNGDGYADLIVGFLQADGAAGADCGAYRVFSGADGSVLQAGWGEGSGDWLGCSVGGAGDVNNDGLDDFVVGAFGDDPNGERSGSASVFAGMAIAPFCGGGAGPPCPCSRTAPLGAGCRNSTGSAGLATASGSSGAADDDLSIHASGLVAGAPALLLAGDQALADGVGTPLGDGILCIGTNVVRLGLALVDGTRRASWGPHLPSAAGWNPGVTRYLQVWYRDPDGRCGTGFNFTNGIRVTLLP